MVKKSVNELGKSVPSSLKFGIIVTIAILWADFIKVVTENWIATYFGGGSGIPELILAVSATAIAYSILISYRKITYALGKIKIKR